MTSQKEPTADPRLVSSAMMSFLQIGTLLILLVWCFEILSPFIQIITSAVIIAVAIYPLHVRLTSIFGGRAKLSAALLALIGIALVVVPAWFLAGSTIGSLHNISENLSDGRTSVAAPAERVAHWPVIGDKLFELWSATAVNMEAVLNQFGPQLRSLGERAVGLATGVTFAVLQLVGSFIIAGVLLTTAASGKRLTEAIAARLLGQDRGAALAELSIQTVRSVAKGILGIAFVQALLAAVGLVLMDVPAAGLWAGAVLILAIVQLPPILVLGPVAVWVFSVADPLPATVFLVYSILVGFSDALLKPLFLGRGVEVPMLVVLLGAIGGAFLDGVIGLFVGAVVLAVGYQILMAWLAVEAEETVSEEPASGS